MKRDPLPRLHFLNFVFDEDKDDANYYHHVVQLMDMDQGTVF